MQDPLPFSSGPCATAEGLDRFLRGELSGEESNRVASHLEQCADCHRLMETMATQDGAQSIRWHASARDSEMPESLLDRLYGLADGSSRMAATPSTSKIFPEHGKHFGRFELRECLGKGGHGTVYRAWDPSLQREVALKIPRYAVFDRSARDQFLREGRTAGRLQHPNLVPVHEVGEVDGACYLALKYCPGPTLAAWLTEHPHGIESYVAANMVRKLANAVGHAHDEGVLHRDIKPENVILEPTTRNGRQEFEPKLTDFGVAKLLDPSVTETRTGVVIGTLPYMAPEQASAERGAIGPSVDIYALGVLLYELLSGRVPHRGETQTETLRSILLDEPTALRKLRPEIPRDLEAICLKCLEKNPQRRYAQAADLSDDLRRFLEHQPTLARPVAWPERARRWAVRNPAWAMLAGIVLMVSASGLAGVAFHLRTLQGANRDLQSALGEARSERQRAVDSQRSMRIALYSSDLQLASQAFESGDARHAAMILARHVPAPGEDDVRCVGWHWLSRLVSPEREPVPGHQNNVYCIRFSPDRTLLATAGSEGIVRLFDADSKTLKLEIATGQGEINSIDFDPMRAELASAGDDGSICIWELQRGIRLRRIEAHEQAAYGVRYDASGERLVSCANHPVIKVWDRDTGRLLHELAEHTASVEAIDISPDGRWLVSAGSDRIARLWSLSELRCVHVLMGHQAPLHCVAFSSDSRFVATGGADDTVRVWDVDRGESVFDGRTVETVQTVAFSESPNGLLSSDRSGAVHFWRSDADGEWANSPQSWTSDTSRVWSMADAGDAGFLTAGGDGRVEWWAWPERLAIRQVLMGTQVHLIEFLPNDDGLLIAAGLLGLMHWNLRDSIGGDILERWGDAYDCLGIGVLADGTYAVATRDGTIRIHDRASHRLVQQFELPGEGDRGRSVYSLRDPKTIMVELQFENSGLIALDRDRSSQGEALFPNARQPVVVAPDGNLMAASSTPGNQIHLLDFSHRKLLATLPGHGSTINAMRFSPDGKWLASASADRFIKLWDVQQRQGEMTWIGHRGKVNGLAFSPRGDRIVTGSQDGTLRLWDVASGRMLMILHRDPAGFDQVEWSPGGRYIAAKLFAKKGVVLLDLGTPSDSR